MRIPDDFKELQRKTFQDKEIKYRPATETIGGLGSVSIAPGAVTSTHQVNFQIISDALMAQEWGLVAGRDAIATTSDPIPAVRGDFIQHSVDVYRLKGILVRDSHLKLVLELTDFPAV